MDKLESENIILRAPEPSDIDTLYIWENDMSIWPVSNTITPFSKHLLTKYLEYAHLDIYQTKQLRLIIDLKGKKQVNKPIGTIELFDFDPYHRRAGIGVLIALTQERGKGYAKEALILLINYSFTVLQLHQLYCNISADNNVSLELFKKLDFNIIGEKKEWLNNTGKWTSEYMLQRLNNNL